jgi:hypothetical protein
MVRVVAAFDCVVFIFALRISMFLFVILFFDFSLVYFVVFRGSKLDIHRPLRVVCVCRRRRRRRRCCCCHGCSKANENQQKLKKMKKSLSSSFF